MQNLRQIFRRAFARSENWRGGRDLLAALALFIIAVLGLAVAARPELDAGILSIPTLVLLLLALPLGGRRLWLRPGWGMLMLCLAVLLMLPFTLVAQVFGRVDMLAILHHAGFGTEGMTLAGLSVEVKETLLSLGIFTFASFWLLNLLGAPQSAAALVALLVLLANPLAQFAFGRVAHGAVASVLPKRLVAPALVAPVALPPDLILVYLEGSEQRYENTAAFGAAFAPLAELAAEAISFRGVGQALGTGWSVAGIVASQCGVPLLPNGLRYGNNFLPQTEFLPASTCLGDILAARGYRSAFLVGSEGAFAGMDQFFRRHGNPTLIDIDTLRATMPPATFEAALIEWTLDDQAVFEAAAARYAALVAEPGPVALVVETIGPHGKHGFLSRDCTDTGRARISDDLAAVMRCTAEGARDFVRAVQAAGNGRPQKIVLLSDHLSHYDTNGVLHPPAARFNTVMFLDAARAGEVNTRPGAMFDVFPTLLEWLGFGAPLQRAGLGVSLLGAAPTLTGEFGAGPLDAMLAGDGVLAVALWQ
jgi:phosphoglycerol transferase